jgi:hypothetical protein
MAEVRHPRWTDWLLLIATLLVALVVALFFLRNAASPGFGDDAASSVSNAPGP